MSLLWGYVFESKTILLWLYITFYVCVAQIGFNQFTTPQTPGLNHISTMKQGCLPFVWQEGHQRTRWSWQACWNCFTLPWLWTPSHGVTCHSHCHAVTWFLVVAAETSLKFSSHPCSTQQPSVTELWDNEEFKYLWHNKMKQIHVRKN